MGYDIENEAVSWPFGKADVQTKAYAATIAVTVKNRFTIVVFDTLTGDATLNVTAHAQCEEGHILVLQVPAQTDGFDLTLGTGIDAPAIVGVTGKTKTQAFVYNGSIFIPMGGVVQIN